MIGWKVGKGSSPCNQREDQMARTPAERGGGTIAWQKNQGVRMGLRAGGLHEWLSLLWPSQIWPENMLDTLYLISVYQPHLLDCNWYPYHDRRRCAPVSWIHGCALVSCGRSNEISSVQVISFLLCVISICFSGVSIFSAHTRYETFSRYGFTVCPIGGLTTQPPSIMCDRSGVFLS